MMMLRGEEVPEAERKAFEAADEELFKNVRAIFGGNVRQATSGAAPIAREILEFFFACGVPVLEGYGMTETSTAATFSTPENHKFGTVGRALPGVEIKIADDGEILIKGANIFHGYHNRADIELRRGRGRVAAHRRPRVDRRGRLPVDHRAQEGHHHHRRGQEPDAREHRERAQAVALDLPGRDARRPAPVPGDPDHARRGRDARVGARARPARGHPVALPRSRGARADPAGSRQGQRQIRPGRAGQEVRDPRPRPLPADRRADADAEGQAQRRQREVRGDLRLAVQPADGPPRPQLRESRARCAPIQPKTGACSSGAGPGTAPVRFRTLPETRQRSCASASTARWPTMLLVGDDRAVPAVLGTDPAGLPVAGLGGPVHHRQREPRHPDAPSWRCSRSCSACWYCCAGWMRCGFWCAAPPATTSAPGRWGGSSPSRPCVCAAAFLAWFLVIHGPGNLNNRGG